MRARPIALCHQVTLLKETTLEIFSPLISVSRSIAKSLLATMSKLAKNDLCSAHFGKPFDLEPELTTQILEKLNKKNPIEQVLNRVFCRSSNLNEQHQIAKQLTANILKEAAMRSIGCSNLSLPQIIRLAKEIAKNEIQEEKEKHIKKYIKKSAPHILKYIKENTEILIEINSKTKENESTKKTKESRLNPEIKKLIIENKKNTIKFTKEDVYDLVVSGYSIENKQKNLYKLGELIEKFNELEELKKIKEDIEFSLSIENPLGPRFNWNLNHGKSKDKVTNTWIKTDWDEEIKKEKIVETLIKEYGNNEIGSKFPSFLEQLIQCIVERKEHYTIFYTLENKNPIIFENIIKIKKEDGTTFNIDNGFKENGLDWRKKEFPNEVKKLESEIKRAFFYEKEIRTINKETINEKRKEIRETILKCNDFARLYPSVFDKILELKFKDFSDLFFNENIECNSNNKNEIPSFKGNYLKKENEEEKTRVKSSTGNVYELINTLENNNSKELYHQHDLYKKNKVILGEGGFGKVRLALDVSTNTYVAVKKFSASIKRGDFHPHIEANFEVKNLEIVKNALLDKEASSFAEMLDYALVSVPQKNSTETVKKAYIFTPLINGGDGRNAIKALRKMRKSGDSKKIQEANTRCIHIAKSYAKAISDFHEKGLCHIDIKPANFLHTKANENGPEKIKLADFGMIQNEEDHTFHKNCTIEFIPPEAEENNIDYLPKAHDNFSFGITLLQLRNAIYPENKNNTLTRIFLDGTTQSEKLSFEPGTHRCNGINVEEGVDVLAENVPLNMTHLDTIIARLLSITVDDRLSAKDAFDCLEKIEQSLKFQNMDLLQKVDS